MRLIRNTSIDFFFRRLRIEPGPYGWKGKKLQFDYAGVGEFFKFCIFIFYVNQFFRFRLMVLWCFRCISQLVCVICDRDLHIVVLVEIFDPLGLLRLELPISRTKVKRSVEALLSRRSQDKN
jgi:hypothetical protein